MSDADRARPWPPASEPWITSTSGGRCFNAVVVSAIELIWSQIWGVVVSLDLDSYSESSLFPS